MLPEVFNHFLKFSEVSTDSRSIEENSLFFAIKGENFNGNKFVQQAFDAGAAMAFVDELDGVINSRCILVDDTVKELQNFATSYVKWLKTNGNTKVLALTGSNGKTTTKELCKVVLENKYKVFATKGNLNNHLGVPLTILSAPKTTEVLILEMGANHPGEIKDLSEIGCPDIGLITNIGKAHLEGFGDLLGVQRAKNELFEYINSHKGTILLNTNDPLLKDLAGKFPQSTIVKYGNESGVKGEIFELSPHFTIQISEHLIQPKLYGAYNLDNILAAWTIGELLKVPTIDIIKSIESYESDNMRSQVIIKETNTMIVDTYNANPSSMKAALLSFIEFKASSKCVIVGEMLELGDSSDFEHAYLYEFLKEKFSNVLFVGKNFAKLVSSKDYYFSDSSELKNWLTDQQYSNTTFLIKGSRGNKLEIILDEF